MENTLNNETQMLMSVNQFKVLIFVIIFYYTIVTQSNTYMCQYKR
jgi:hypothetical protein